MQVCGYVGWKANFHYSETIKLSMKKVCNPAYIPTYQPTYLKKTLQHSNQPNT